MQDSNQWVAALPDTFYDAYSQKQPPWRNALGYAVYKRTYARKVDGNRTEEWWETCRRVHKSALTQGRYTHEEAVRLYEHMFHMRLNYAGRGLWQHGTATVDRLGGASLNNCWGVLADHYKSFIFMFDQLMLGGGVGINVQREYVGRLPKIRGGVKIARRDGVDGTSKHFIVPDMREGWASLLSKVLKAFMYTGEGFSYSLHCIRSENAPIKGFGGIASGPQHLEKGIEDICRILRSRAGRFLRPVDCADIACIIGEIVRSGNVRRSAIIVVGDPDDKEFLRFKRWSLGTLPGWRGNANISVACSDLNQLDEEYWINYELDEHDKAKGECYGLVNFDLAQKFGRIGHLKADEGAIVPNPCVTGDTLVGTSRGWVRIDSLVGSAPEVYGSDGLVHQTTRVIKTGRRKVLRIETKAGYELKLTPDHRVLTPGGDVEAQALEVGSEIILGRVGFGARSEASNLVEFLGYVVGNGFVSDGALGVNAGVDSAGLMSSFADVVNAWKRDHEEPGSQGARPVSVRPVPTGLKISSCLPGLVEYLTQFAILDEGSVEKQFKGRVHDFDKLSLAALLRGLFTADGTVGDCEGKTAYVALDSSSLTLLRQVQMFLLGFGIKGKIYKNRRPEGFREMPDGRGGSKEYLTKAQHSLRISKSSRFKFEDEIGFMGLSHKAAALSTLNKEVSAYRERMTDPVASIDLLDEEDVYDLTEPTTSHFVANGIVVHNCGEILLKAVPGTGQGEPCNLGVAVLPNIRNKDEFLDCCRLGLRMLKGVASLDYHWPVTNQVVHENMRLGLSLTGICEFIPKEGKDTLKQWCDEGYAAMEDEDRWYSEMMGWPLSIKYTTIKPDGTMGKVFGTTNGIHTAYAEYQIVRVQVKTTNPLAHQLREQGYRVEYLRNLAGETDHNTFVIEFPIHNEGMIYAKDLTAIEQLELTAWAYERWADNAVSVTIYLHKGELPGVKEWLGQNFHRLKTVSFLWHTEHGYDQAPQEPISEERFREESARVEGVFHVSGNTSELEPDAGLECEGGACPVK